MDVLVASDADARAGFEVAARLVGGHGEEVVRDVWIGEAVSLALCVHVIWRRLLMRSCLVGRVDCNLWRRRVCSGVDGGGRR